jgi:acyl-CoA reductase-like NAD-dependent aldehyde dehydrogenase
MARAKAAAKAAITKVAGGEAASEAAAWAPARLGVRKAYKMYVGGAFVRSESGRYFQVEEARGVSTSSRENIPLGSRKDARDAVLAAHAAFGGWSKRVAANRGQILYRLAEMIDARAEELEQSLVRSGLSLAEARREVIATVDRTVSYAGWTDKYQSLFASLNPVGGPHFDFSIPEPVGLVVIAAPQRPSLLGLVGAALPVIASGNVCIALASELDPRTPLVLAEALATSDLPGGVVNILSGRTKEMLVPLARHQDVQALDLHDVEPALARECEDLAADSVKRFRARTLAAEAWFDHAACTSPRWIERFVELKTIWHPSGA